MDPTPPPVTMRPPQPDAAPAGSPLLRRAAATQAPARTLVRVTQPDLLRRAILERTRGRLVIAAFGFAGLFGVVALKLAMATVLNPAKAAAPPRCRGRPHRPPRRPSHAPPSPTAMARSWRSRCR
jgi:cell division protein FtsI (penicillin-binding protein 3)